MKTFLDIKDGDTLWVRVMFSDDNWRTERVVAAQIDHITMDSDEVSRMCGFKENQIRIVTFKDYAASKFALIMSRADSNVYQKGLSFYYTEKDALIRDLQKEKDKEMVRYDNLMK